MAEQFVNCSADSTPQAIEKSASVSRIIYILCYYSKWLRQRINKNDLLAYSKQDVDDHKINAEQNQKNGIYAWIQNLSPSYTLDKLLDDFHYILSFHTSIDNDNLEVLTKYIRQQMLSNDKDDPNINLQDSIQFIRSRYKQSSAQYNGIRTAMYCGYTESTDVCCQQILDSIHCFLLFTFDIGHRLTAQQSANLEETEQDDNALIDQKFKFIKDTICKQEEKDPKDKEELKYDEHLDVFDGGIKFYYWNKAKQEEKDPKDKEELKYDEHLDVFDGGIKFYYWNKAKHDNPWYVTAKHNSLKDEMTSLISTDEWNVIHVKSECIFQTNVAKILKSSSYFAEEYEIEYRSPISAQHIASLILYTNFRDLRKCFNDTFYARTKDETVQSIIDRHRVFGCFGRLLRESVELFGLQSDDCDAPSIYYFGLNKRCVFPSTIPYIYSPLLTTASMNVALLTKKGLICSIRPYEQYLRYFDCQWIADDIGRNEKLFMGGYAPLVIYNIYDIQTCANYSTYVIAIDYLNHMIKAAPYFCDDEQEINDRTIQIIMDLISGKKEGRIPPYIKALYECNRKSIKAIDINMRLMMHEHVEEDTFGYKAL
eukprot:1036927_1